MFSASLVRAEDRPRPSPSPTVASPAPPAPPPDERRLAIHFGQATVGDSNIDHDFEARPDVGVVLAAGLSWRNRVARPTVELAYEAAFHRYHESPKWNRTSHHALGVFEVPLGRRLRLHTTADASLRGTSEDRETADQYALVPRLELRLARPVAVRLDGAARLKRYPAPDRDRDALNTYGSAELRLRAGPARIELGSRYETNDARSDRYDFVRWTHDVALSVGLGRRDNLGLEMRYRDQHYPRRLVNTPGGRAARHDVRWIPTVSWEHRFEGPLALGVDYKYERRNSNDPDKAFRAHLVSLSFTYRWVAAPSRRLRSRAAPR